MTCTARITLTKYRLLTRLVGSVFLGASCHLILAQVGPLPLEGCKIKFDYDGAGNRTERYWFCWSDRSVTAPGSPDALKAIDSVHVESTLVSLGPVPAKDHTVLSVDRDLANAAITVLDAQGRPVLSSILSDRSARLDLHALSSGTYFVQLEFDGARVVRKLLVATEAPVH